MFQGDIDMDIDIDLAFRAPRVRLLYRVLDALSLEP